MEESVDRETFFNQPNVAILATTGPGQRPHAMPVWYLFEGGRFIISTSPNSQKVRNVERQGEATLVIDRRETPCYAVMVRGAAEIGPPMSSEMRLRLAVRYLGEKKGRAYAAFREEADSVSIYLTPVDVIEYHGVAGRSDYSSLR